MTKEAAATTIALICGKYGSLRKIVVDGKKVLRRAIQSWQEVEREKIKALSQFECGAQNGLIAANRLNVRPLSPFIPFVFLLSMQK